MSVNYQGTVNILESLKNINSKAYIHLPGSGEEYGKIYENEIPINELTTLRPVNPYAVTKVAQDLIGYVYHESYGLNVIRTRAFNHEGPRRQNVFGIPSYAYQIAKIEKGLQEPLIKVGKINDRRNFTHVKDMVEAYYLSVKYCKPGELYLIGNEDPNSVHTFKDALEKLIAMSDFKSIKYVEHKSFVRLTDVPRLIANVKKFQDLTSWIPKISFEKILIDTLNYWREQISLNPKL
jgi:GDP-4-dehydro-6-deoxy-D-mannose reductase